MGITDLVVPIFIIVIFWLFFRSFFKSFSKHRSFAKAAAILPPVKDGDLYGEGNMQFSGVTGGISWKMDSIILSMAFGSKSSQAWKRKSVWKSADIRWPEGKFLMIMSSPKETGLGNFQKTTGVLNKFLQFAIDKMLDLYVGGYFGNEYTALVGVENGGKVISKEGAKDFFMLTNHEGLAEKFLDDATLNAISAWKRQKTGFRQEAQVDLFGVLFAPDAMMVSCQAALREQEEVKMFSDFASAMAVKMKGVLG
ncbi:MAG TPA: hypothetical protein VI583_15290 [Cyclobacteriaceae bacterium]|nr:hypothetical protein [Cyclobacteriaceae bacterium]